MKENYSRETLFFNSSSVRDVTISWHGAFVGKKRKKVQRVANLCLFWTLWKKRNWRAFDDSQLVDQANATLETKMK